MLRLVVWSAALLCTVVPITPLPAVAACDPTISLDVSRPDGSEAEPVVVAAQVTSGCAVTSIHVYVDDVLTYRQFGQARLDARPVMGAGPHRVTIKAWNTAGAVAREERFIVADADPVEPPAGCGDALEIVQGARYTGAAVPVTTTSPVRVGMVANGPSRISSMRMYIDGVNRGQVWGTSGYCLPAAMIPLGPGYHFINITAWDAQGNIFHTGSMVRVVP